MALGARSTWGVSTEVGRRERKATFGGSQNKNAGPDTTASPMWKQNTTQQQKQHQRQPPVCREPTSRSKRHRKRKRKTEKTGWSWGGKPRAKSSRARRLPRWVRSRPTPPTPVEGCGRSSLGGYFTGRGSRQMRNDTIIDVMQNPRRQNVRSLKP